MRIIVSEENTSGSPNRDERRLYLHQTEVTIRRHHADIPPRID